MIKGQQNTVQLALTGSLGARLLTLWDGGNRVGKALWDSRRLRFGTGCQNDTLERFGVWLDDLGHRIGRPIGLALRFSAPL